MLCISQRININWHIRYLNHQTLVWALKILYQWVSIRKYLCGSLQLPWHSYKWCYYKYLYFWLMQNRWINMNMKRSTSFYNKTNSDVSLFTRVWSIWSWMSHKNLTSHNMFLVQTTCLLNGPWVEINGLLTVILKGLKLQQLISEYSFNCLIVALLHWSQIHELLLRFLVYFCTT